MRTNALRSAPSVALVSTPNVNLKDRMKPFPRLLAPLFISVALSASAQTTHYVSSNGSQIPPFNTWQTAATNIQAAVAVAANGDTVLVTNGFYNTGVVASLGLTTNRVCITAVITLRSVNGPAVTIISGAASMRCVWLEANAVLSGFTLTNGQAGSFGNVSDYWGGGVCGGIVTNCILTGNEAQNGGGAAESTLFNCILTGNNAAFTSSGSAWYCTLNNCTLTDSSGGACFCTLDNCFIAGNSSYGATGCTLNNCTVVSNGYGVIGWNEPNLPSALTNCIVYNNTGSNYDTDDTNCFMNYCCTTPLPPGPGNIASNPMFVNEAAGNYHLMPNSPCINAGNNAYVVGTTDLDGNPRIVNGTVDMGAYEYQGLPGGSPTITNQPVSTTVAPSGSVTLTVGVSGTPPFTYQWSFNGTNLVGATNATLTISDCSPANTGDYTVTVSNPGGSVTSQAATVASVDLKLFAGVIVNGPVGSNYLIQATSNLSNGWTTLTNVALPTQPYIFIDYNSPWNPRQFYRAVPQ